MSTLAEESSPSKLIFEVPQKQGKAHENKNRCKGTSAFMQTVAFQTYRKLRVESVPADTQEASAQHAYYGHLPFPC